VVGVDGTEASFEACRQSARLADPRASIAAVAVVHLADAIQADIEATHAADPLRDEATTAMDEAIAILGARATRRFVNGFVTDALLREVERTAATLLALGSHGHRRATEILFGGPAGELLHTAPCSVLMARPPRDPERFPAAIVVGVDGSRDADKARAVAHGLAGRLGSSLRAVTVSAGKEGDAEQVRVADPLVEVVDGRPVDALVAAATGADLLVVGSRGVHGLRALGSVSERVAHEAACSVLVVRSPEHT
jgi:nucleotide-binding universal stress UspA family protein